MAFYDKFPYTNFQELNLDRIIQELMKVKEGLNFVIDNATLKYADPIQWNITRQYQANTVVIDPATGIAYISTKPVPDNIQITDTGYWTPIFDLGSLFDDLAGQITAEETARQEADAALSDDIAAEATARENADTALSDDIAAEATARENADTALSDDIAAEATARQEDISAVNTRIDSLVIETEYPNFDIRRYGGKGDGVTNDTAAFNACMAANNIVYLPNFFGANYVLDTITLTSNQTVIGEKTQITQNQNLLFRITGENITIRGLEVRNATGVNGITFMIRALAAISDILIEDVSVYDCTTALSDAESTSIYTRLYVNRLTAQHVNGVGVSLTHAYAFLFLNDVTIDKVGVTAATACFVFENNQGAHLVRCEAEGGATDGSHAGAIGFIFKNCQAVWLERCMADTVDGSGFYLDGNNNRYFYFVSCVASLMFNHGFVLNGTSIMMANCLVVGRTGLPATLPSANGIYSFASYLNIANLEAVGMTGYQVALMGGQKVNLSNIQMADGGNSLYAADGVTGYMCGGVSSYSNIDSASVPFKYCIYSTVTGTVLRNDV